jgi:hypothetical protein
MSESTLDAPVMPRQPRWRRRLLFVFFLLAGVGAAGAGFLWYTSRAARQTLADVIAEIDRTDPGWRWDDLQAARATPPDEQNSALQLLAAKKLLPSDWKQEPVSFQLSEVPDQEQLTPEQRKSLEAELQKMSPALAEARKVKDMPVGRPPLQPAANLMAVLLPHVQIMREWAMLLSYDAELHAQQGDMEGAFESLRAAVNVSRSIGDEPTLISQLVRWAMRGIALRELERLLAQGEASEQALAPVQALLEMDDSEPDFLYAVRGERAFEENMIQQMQAGNVSLWQMAGGGPAGGKLRIGSLDVEELVYRLFNGPPSAHFADMLRFTTQAVGIARKPLEEQAEEIAELEAGLKSRPTMVRLLAPAVTKVHTAYLRSHAQLRCSAAAVAAERFRLAHGRWPESLEELVGAGLLARVPVDPYTRSSLILRRLGDGLAIYSVGPDKQDNGGQFDRKNQARPGTDVGLRLWDVNARRQTPRGPDAPGQPAAPAGPGDHPSDGV